MPQIMSKSMSEDYLTYTDVERLFGEKFQILSRLDRIEEEIKHQNEKFELIIHQMDKRFEQVDKRFEQVDKRFDQMQHQMDKRFEQVDKRFDQVDKRFNSMQWMIGIGFSVIVILSTLFKYIN